MAEDKNINKDHKFGPSLKNKNTVEILSEKVSKNKNKVDKFLKGKEQYGYPAETAVKLLKKKGRS